MTFQLPGLLAPDPEPAPDAWDSLLALRPVGGFDLIMADPPWAFRTYSAKGQGRSPERHYRTMTLDRIKAMPVAALAAPDTILWLWATAPLLPRALEVLDAWGFRYATMGYWGKVSARGQVQIGGGYRLRCSGEPFLIGTKGAPPLGSRSVRSLLLSARREHSRKPDESYTAAAALAPWAKQRLDLFSRETREGWTAWGDEAGSLDVEKKMDRARPPRDKGTHVPQSGAGQNEAGRGRYQHPPAPIIATCKEPRMPTTPYDTGGSPSSPSPSGPTGQEAPS